MVGAWSLAVGVFAMWAHDSAGDPATYEQARVLDLEEGGLEGLIGDRITETLMGWADLDLRIDSALPGPLGSLGGPTESLTTRVLDEAIAGVLAQPAIRSLIADLEQRIDRELVNLLLDDSSLLRLEDETVILDLDPLIAEVIVRIDDTIPSFVLRLAPDLSVDMLLPGAVTDGGVELAIGVLPSLVAAEASANRLDDLATRLPLLGVALLLAAVALSPRRIEALRVGSVALLGLSLLILMAAFSSEGWPLTGTLRPIEAIAGAPLTDTHGGALTVRLGLLAVVGAIGAGAAWGLDHRAGRDGNADPNPTDATSRPMPA